MGVHVIKMPDIGEGIAEVELVAWHVRPGAVVAEDQVLADVMTDKATVEIPSPVAGRVLALGGEVGQVLAVGAELIRIEVEGAGNLAAPPPAAAVAVAPPPPPPPSPAWPAAPAPQAAAQSRPEPPAAAVPPPGNERPIASPAVRRRAWELGIDLAQVRATGTAGRIVQADLDAHVASGAPRLSAGGAAGARLQPREGEEAVRVIGLRRKIAQKMQEAKRRIPHFTYVEEVDVTELEALRARLNGRSGARRPHLTLLPFLMRAMVLAVERFPDFNARFDDEAGVLTRHRAVHIGIATQTEAGLLVPVLRHAEALDLWASAAEVARLAEAARSGKVVRAELSGSTITLTSLGALGGLVATPVINHPEVAIVGVNRMVERPVLRAGVWVPRLLMNLSCSFDHRVIDGLHAAEFVQALRGHLECPATLFMEQGDFL
ncbi:dihydrolipoamide acetyltransferase family protein [Ramlibacter sp. 2FC]|uniref:dihydrolipoamide acetyltransferase family protein n=1 Tax=Ramlibacter sp. 2FC TaxID=2502188 RepID=UPI0010F43B2A|nr:dihydrolipoamide acetyltransferase family protein [Ramlibacter sp. 2FC]